MHQACIALFVFSALAVASAKPHPRATCETPKQWEAFAQSYDLSTGYFAHGRMSYDAEGRRAHFAEEVIENSTKIFHDDLFLYEKHVHYRVDGKTKKCSKVAINTTFIPIEIHPNSTYLGEAIIGTLDRPGSGVIVQEWGRQINNETAFQVFTKHGCVPVEDIYRGHHGGEFIHYHHQFFDVRIGIADSAIFDVPKECL